MSPPSYSGYRFPRDIIQRAVWMYLRFRPAQPSGSSRCIRPPTTSSPFLVISSLLARTASSAPKRSRRGATRPVSPPDISRWATRRACARQRDNARRRPSSSPECVRSGAALGPPSLVDDDVRNEAGQVHGDRGGVLAHAEAAGLVADDPASEHRVAVLAGEQA